MKKEIHQKPPRSVKAVLAELERKVRIAEQALSKAPALGFVEGAKYEWEGLPIRTVVLPLSVTNLGDIICSNCEIVFFQGQWAKLLKDG